MAITNRLPDYKDLDLDFIAHPATGDVVKKVGDDAIKRSIRNLILSNFYERPFRPYLGSNAIKLLFDNVSGITQNLLKDAITEVINNYEPRVSLKEVKIEFDFENNGYNVGLSYVILNRGEPIITSIFLERIR